MNTPLTADKSSLYNLIQFPGQTGTSSVTSCAQITIPRQAQTTTSTTSRTLPNLPSTSLKERTITEPLTLEDFFNFLSKEYSSETFKSYQEQCRIHLQNILSNFENLNSPEAIATLERIIKESKKVKESNHTEKGDSGPVAHFVKQLLKYFRLTDLLKTYGNELINDPCSITNLVNFGCTLKDCIEFNVNEMNNPEWIEGRKDYKNLLCCYESKHKEQNHKHVTNNFVLKILEDALDMLMKGDVLDFNTKNNFQNQLFQLIETIVTKNPINDTDNSENDEPQKQLLFISRERDRRINTLRRIAYKFVLLNSDDSYVNVRKIGMLMESSMIPGYFITQDTHEHYLWEARKFQRFYLGD